MTTLVESVDPENVNGAIVASTATNKLEENSHHEIEDEEDSHHDEKHVISENNDDIILLTSRLNDLAVLKSVEDEKDSPIVLYYGFFFNEQVCTSLKAISDKYMKDCFENDQFERFLRDSCAKENGTSDPLSFYRYPSKKKKLQSVPDFHVTTKFCDRDQTTCSEYWREVKDWIGRKCLIHIIGLFFTDKTCGFRVKLTKEQQQILDERRVTSSVTNSQGDSKNSVDHNETGSSSAKKHCKKGQNSNSKKKLIPSSYDGVSVIEKPEEEIKGHKSRAHITIGTAKFVNAKQAGEDLLDIVDLETRLSSVFYKDYRLQCGSTLRQYGVFKDAFVIYLKHQFVAEAEFKFKE